MKTLMFSYDVTNQLTGESVSGGKAGEAYASSYAYDAAGNRTRFEKASSTKNEVTRTSGNKLNQTLASTTATNGGAPLTAGYSYDAAGNMAQVSSATGKSDYAFDDASRLTSIVKRDTAGVALSKSEFAYDGMSRLRISRDFDYVGGAWVSRGEKRRIYDGLNAVQERDGNGALLATYTRGTDMGGGIGGLLCRTFDGGKSFMHYDGRGNVVQLSDGAGAVSGKYAYDAFGNTLSVSGGAAGLNPYRFSTKEHLAGLVYYGFRFYSPSMGKWINRDPIGIEGGINLYNFLKNEPTSKLDKYGNMAQAAIGAIIGGSMAFGFNLYKQVSNGGWECVNWWKAVNAGAWGAAGGALTALVPGWGALTTVEVGVSLGGNMLIGLGTNVAQGVVENQIIDGNCFDRDRAITDALTGAIGGAAGSMNAGSFSGPGGLLDGVTEWHWTIWGGAIVDNLFTEAY